MTANASWSGNRETLAQFKRNTVTQNSRGEEIASGAPTILGSEWVRVMYGQNSERVRAAAEEGRQSAIIEADQNTLTMSVNLKDVVSFDGEDWDILGISPKGRANIRFTVARSVL